MKQALKEFFSGSPDGKLSMTRFLSFFLVVTGVVLICMAVWHDLYNTQPVIHNNVMVSDGHVTIELYGVLLGLISAGIGGKIWSKGKEGKEITIEGTSKT